MASKEGRRKAKNWSSGKLQTAGYYLNRSLYSSPYRNKRREEGWEGVGGKGSKGGERRREEGG